MFVNQSKSIIFFRLNFPGKLTQSGGEIMKISATKFYIKLTKLNKGEVFEGIDMLTKLLMPPKTSNSNLVQAIETESSDKANLENDNIGDENFDWYLNLKLNEDDCFKLNEKYGFAKKHGGIISKLEDEIWDLIEVKNPETKSDKQRSEERVAEENKHFDDDHYLFDLYDQKEIIDEIINFKPSWSCDDKIKFNDSETFRLKNLPKIEYLFNKKEKFHLLLGMVDILFAYAYDMRTCEGEHSVESGWTISKISSTLSWFEVYTSLDQVLIACVRRSLCYPLYRNLKLSMKIIQDTIQILKKGRTFVVKCFLDIHRLFNESGDYRYLFNNLYITDYCVWLQTVKKNTFESLADAIERIEIKKESIELDLNLLEFAADLAIKESNQLRVKNG